MRLREHNNEFFTSINRGQPAVWLAPRQSALRRQRHGREPLLRPLNAYGTIGNNGARRKQPSAHSLFIFQGTFGMTQPLSAERRTQALQTLAQAVQGGLISAGAEPNIRAWLSEPRYAEYAVQVAEHLEQDKWKPLHDAFWTIIPLGTGGRRGRMYPIGSNAINDRTIGESAQGLAEYVCAHPEAFVPALGENDGLSCAIAYDTRHRSREFAELCAEIMVANGFKVCFLDCHRSTPSLSVTVRHKRCNCGIMVTASHNPPSDNAVKVYGSTGGQLLPPHDQGVIDCVMNVDQIQRRPFAECLAEGLVEYCQEEVDLVYLENILAQSQLLNHDDDDRPISILYSPMHGVGATSVLPALSGAGFHQVEVFGPQAKPDGDFPNVPGHVSNPENPETFTAMIARAEESGADIILSTDPDADRLGAAARLGQGEKFVPFTGNQIGALLADFVLSCRKEAKTLSPEHYVVKTLVTTELTRRVADSYGAKTYGNLLVGFKWIAQVIDQVGPEKFVLGTEESHGFQVGVYARDKDGAVAAMLLAELAVKCKAAGQTLHEKLDELFIKHGAHAERTVSVSFPGSEGMARMTQLMSQLRSEPPEQLAGISVAQVRDYENLLVTPRGGKPAPLDGPKGDLVICDLQAEGNYAAVRPSGTEPKVKFYMFTYEPVAGAADLPAAKTMLAERLDALEADLKRVALG